MTVEEENARLREQLREMTARAMGHAYASQMAEGAEDIQHQEAKYERQQHAETRATLRRYEAELTRIMTLYANTRLASEIRTVLSEGEES